jgi:hypothetical protein
LTVEGVRGGVPGVVEPGSVIVIECQEEACRAGSVGPNFVGSTSFAATDEAAGAPEGLATRSVVNPR